MSFSDWLADRIFLPFNNQQVDCSCRIWLENTKRNEKVSATSKLVRSAKSIQIIPCRCPPRPKVIMVYKPANITGDNWRAPSCPTSGPVFPTLSIVMMNDFVPKLSAASRWKWDANKRDRSHCWWYQWYRQLEKFSLNPASWWKISLWFLRRIFLFETRLFIIFHRSPRMFHDFSHDFPLENQGLITDVPWFSLVFFVHPGAKDRTSGSGRSSLRRRILVAQWTSFSLW